MGAMYKKEVLIKPTSTITTDAAISWVSSWLDAFYTGELAPVFPDSLSDDLVEIIGKAVKSSGNANYDPKQYGSTAYDDFFADLFDARDGSEIRIYHAACEQSKGMTKLVYRKTESLTRSLTESITKAVLAQPSEPQVVNTTVTQALSEEEKKTLVDKTVAATKAELTEQLTRELTLKITAQVTKQVLAVLPKNTTGESSGMTETEISAVVESKAAALVEKQLPMLQEKIEQFFLEKTQPLDADFKVLRDDINKSLGELKIVQDDITAKKQAIDSQVAFFVAEKEKATQLSTQHAESSQQAHDDIQTSIAELRQLDQGIADQLKQNTEADNLRLEKLNAAEQTLTEKFISLEQLVKTANELSASSREAIIEAASKAEKETGAIIAELRLEVEKASSGEAMMNLEMSLQTLKETVDLLPKTSTATDTSKITQSLDSLTDTVEQLRSQVNTNSEKLNQPAVQPTATVEVEVEEEIIADEFADDMGGMP